VGAALGSVNGQPAHGGTDFVVAKYNPQGQELWTRQIGTPGFELGTDLAVDDAGNAYAVGVTDAGAPGTGRNGLVVRIDADGTVRWQRQLASFGNDIANGVTFDRSVGGVFVTGTTNGALDGNQNACAPGCVTGPSVDYFLSRFDVTGTKQWTRQVGSQQFRYSQDDAHSVTDDDHGHIFVAGTTTGSLGGSGHVDNAGDAFVAEFDATGNSLGTHKEFTDQVDVGVDVASSQSGVVYLTGWTFGQMNGWPNPSGTREATFLVKLSYP